MDPTNSLCHEEYGLLKNNMTCEGLKVQLL